MKKLQSIFALIALTVLLGTTPSHARILFQDDFEGHSSSLNASGMTAWGPQATLDSSGGYNGSKAARIAYDSSGVNAGVAIDTSVYNLGEIYVRFYAKVDCGAGVCAGGSKFLKLFGINNGGYANSTLMMEYTNGLVSNIYYGNGSSTQNDAGTAVFLSGGGWDAGVQTSPALGSINLNDKQWHCYELYMKFSNNGQSDGEYDLWKDGKLWFKATNIKNRNDSNVRQFDYISLGGYSSGPQWTTPYTMWFDNVVIADQYIGPISTTPKLSAPTNLRVL